MQTADLYEAYFAEMLHYLKCFVSEQQAEDLAQEVFIKADKGLADFRGEASPKTWLYRITTNTLRDFLRSKGHRSDASLVRIPVEELERYADPISADASLDEDTIRYEMNACIREFIQRLPENYSTVLVLSDLEGHTRPEVADILGLSLDTVKIRLHRARNRLKAELSQGCDISLNSENVLQCQRKEE